LEEEKEKYNSPIKNKRKCGRGERKNPYIWEHSRSVSFNFLFFPGLFFLRRAISQDA
jgi:hypothetical protein